MEEENKWSLCSVCSLPWEFHKVDNSSVHVPSIFCPVRGKQTEETIELTIEENNSLKIYDCWQDIIAFLKLDTDKVGDRCKMHKIKDIMKKHLTTNP